jgi:hypothetical protein
MAVSRQKTRSEVPAQEIELIDGRKVPLRVVINPRARRITLRFDPTTREAVAVAPSPRQAPKAAAFAFERVGWIARQLTLSPAPILFRPEVEIPVRGAPHILREGEGRTIKVTPGLPTVLSVPAGDDALFGARVRRFLMAEAKKDLTARALAHAGKIGVRWSRLTVKDTKSRWGSCTSDGALSFSWRVILAPPFVLDYLAAHEVAHLKELNHSSRFWKLVAQCIPDYARAEEWLRRNGAQLHAIGPKV